MDAFKQLLDFYKAQSIKDPVALATYVTRRYGTMDKFAMARGMVGKKRAKEWNPVRNTGTGGPKGGKSPGSQTQGSLKIRGGGKEKKMPTTYKDPKGKVKRSETGGGTRSKEGGYKTRQSFKSLGLDKAQPIEDTRELAHHLSGPSAKRPTGGSKRLWHGGTAGERAWHEFEGGIRSKDNAKEWNPLVGGDTDEKGKKYNLGTGMVERDKKKEKQPRLGGKFAGRGKTGKEEPSYQPAMKIGGKRIGAKKGATAKSMDILTKAFKFGGKPLKWEDLPRDPISFATNVMQDKGYKFTNLSAGSKGAKMRNTLSQGVRALIRDIPEASKKHIQEGAKKDDLNKKEAQKIAEDMQDSWKDGKIDKANMPITNPSISYAPASTQKPKDDNKVIQKISPGLARLMGAAAGWALSDSIVEAGGGSPRGQMTPAQQREWERLVRNSMRRNRGLTKEHMDNLRGHWNDLSDTYVRRVPINNSLNIQKGVILSKDHLPIPPRQGLMFDPIKHRWTSQDKIGRTVTEVQGKKRIRGTGTGVHEHSLKTGRIGGKGAGSAEAGRRFRSTGDLGVQHPHETSNPTTRMTEHKKLLHRQVIAHTKRKKSEAEKAHEASAKVHASIQRSHSSMNGAKSNGAKRNGAKALSRTHKLLARHSTKQTKSTKSVGRR